MFFIYPGVWRRVVYLWIVIALLALTSSCTSSQWKNSNSKSVDVVDARLAQTHAGSHFISREKTEGSEALQRLLAMPLSPQVAVDILLINSPRIQKDRLTLGIADTEKWQASVIENPRFSLALLKPTHASQWMWDFGVSESLAQLFTRSTREKIAEAHASLTQLDVVSDIHLAIAELEQAYFSAIAAKQAYDIQLSLNQAAEAKKALAESLFAAGNMSEADYLGYLSEAQHDEHQLALMGDQVEAQQVGLRYLLGLSTEKLLLPDSLPNLPNEQFDANHFIQVAQADHIDIRRKQQERALLESERSAIKKDYALSDARIGLAVKRESDGVKSRGPTLEIAPPLFDKGSAKLAETDLKIATIDTELREIKIRIARDIQLAILQLRAAQMHVGHLSEVESTANKQLNLTQREVNYMLSSPFVLIDQKAKTIGFQQERASIQLGYWHARSQLELAVGHRIELNNNISNDLAHPSTDQTDPHAHHHDAGHEEGVTHHD